MAVTQLHKLGILRDLLTSTGYNETTFQMRKMETVGLSTVGSPSILVLILGGKSLLGQPCWFAKRQMPHKRRAEFIAREYRVPESKFISLKPRV